jgi:succinate dehydrogenase/fumarate reductase flavoprotein subunit
MASRPTKWDLETDVLVFGTGAAALTAAILARSAAHTT